MDHKQGRNLDPSPATLVKLAAGFAAFNSVEEARENAPNILRENIFNTNNLFMQCI